MYAQCNRRGMGGPLLCLQRGERELVLAVVGSQKQNHCVPENSKRDDMFLMHYEQPRELCFCVPQQPKPRPNALKKTASWKPSPIWGSTKLPYHWIYPWLWSSWTSLGPGGISLFGSCWTLWGVFLLLPGHVTGQRTTQPSSLFSGGSALCFRPVLSFHWSFDSQSPLSLVCCPLALPIFSSLPPLLSPRRLYLWSKHFVQSFTMQSSRAGPVTRVTDVLML